MIYFLIFVLAGVLALCLHSSGHYLFSRLVFKLPCQLHLGTGFTKAELAKGPGIYFGWFPFISYFRISENLKPQTNGSPPPLKSLLIYLSGILISLCLAFVFLVFSQMVSHKEIRGNPYDQTLPPIVSEVLPGSAAELAGIQPKDKVLLIDEKPIETFEKISRIVRDSQGPLRVTIFRDPQKINLTLNPELSPQGNRIIGISSVQPKESYRPITMNKSIQMAWTAITHQIWIFLGMEDFRDPKNLGGPIRISTLQKVEHNHFSVFLYFLSLFSLGLALWNLIPLPPFDLGNGLGLALGIPVKLLRNGRFLGILLALILVTLMFSKYSAL